MDDKNNLAEDKIVESVGAAYRCLACNRMTVLKEGFDPTTHQPQRVVHYCSDYREGIALFMGVISNTD